MGRAYVFFRPDDGLAAPEVYDSFGNICGPRPRALMKYFDRCGDWEDWWGGLVGRNSKELLKYVTCNRYNSQLIIFNGYSYSIIYLYLYMYTYI